MMLFSNSMKRFPGTVVVQYWIESTKNLMQRKDLLEHI